MAVKPSIDISSYACWWHCLLCQGRVRCYRLPSSFSQFGLHSTFPDQKPNYSPHMDLTSWTSLQTVTLLKVLPISAASKHLMDTAGQTSHVESILHPQLCRHLTTCDTPNISPSRLKFMFTKLWFSQPFCMHPKRGPCLPVTWKPYNPFTSWNVSEGSSESHRTISSRTTVSSCTGLPPLSHWIMRGTECHIQSCGKVTRQHSGTSGPAMANRTFCRQIFKCQPHRRRAKWTDQLRRDDNIP